MHEAGQQVHSQGGQAYSSGYAAGFSFATSLSGEQLQLKNFAEQIRSPGMAWILGNTTAHAHTVPVPSTIIYFAEQQGIGTLSPFDPVWSAPLSTSQKANAGMES